MSKSLVTLCRGGILPLALKLEHFWSLSDHSLLGDADAVGANWLPICCSTTSYDANTATATSAIAPPLLLHSLHRAHLLPQGSKILLISSESGSITLRHAVEGGGNYGHHASKAALNMVGKLLSLDLKEDKIIASIVHPGFMRTEMTKGVGFDKYWDDGGAVTPDVAAKSLVEWVEGLDEGKSGEYWAPRGWGDIGTAEKVLGKEVSQEKGPAKLPW